MAPANDLVFECLLNGTCCSYEGVQCPPYHQETLTVFITARFIDYFAKVVVATFITALGLFVCCSPDIEMAQIRGTAGYNLGAQDRFGVAGRADATNDPSPLDAIREQTSKIEDWLDTLSDPIKPYVSLMNTAKAQMRFWLRADSEFSL